MNSPWRSSGFTLVEMLVVVAIVGLLATVVTVTVGGTSPQARDAQRQSDLRNLQQAIEMYRTENGRYPEGCNGPNDWAGQLGTDNFCDRGGAYASVRNTGQYIMGLAPKYISVLPTDPRLPSGGGNVGYVYRTNGQGTVYKIMAMNTVEADELLRSGTAAAYTHPFASCDMRTGIDNNGTPTLLNGYSPCYRVRLADNTDWEEGTPPARCSLTNSRFQSSYALWGGTTPVAGTGSPDDGDFNLTDPERRGMRYTTAVTCR